MISHVTRTDGFCGCFMRGQAMKALLSCPTYSIHMDDRTREELQEGQQGLPALVEGE
jgi:hypothetical protein